jgi:hypothetical protein
LGLEFASGCESLVPLVSVAAEAVAAAVDMLAMRVRLFTVVQ